jgi:uncharacterized protein YdaU (DUF1376 family)
MVEATTASGAPNDRVLATLAHCTPEEWDRVKLSVSRAFDHNVRVGWWAQLRMIATSKEQDKKFRQLSMGGRKGGKARAYKSSQAKARLNLEVEASLNRSGTGSSTGTGTGEDKDRALTILQTSIPVEAPSKPPPVPAKSGGRSRKGDFPKHDPLGFARFYAAYPKKEDRPAAIKAWEKLRPDAELVEEIMAGLGRYITAKTGGDFQFVKQPGPWLNARRWEDAPPPPIDRARIVAQSAPDAAKRALEDESAKRSAEAARAARERERLEWLKEQEELSRNGGGA